MQAEMSTSTVNDASNYSILSANVQIASFQIALWQTRRIFSGGRHV
jgi:hypothetical protein